MSSSASKKEPSPRSPAHLEADQPVRADWSAYAAAYDLLSDHNPEYQALMQGFEDFVTTIEPPSVIYDIGGGTGNYTQIAAKAFPDSEIRLIEPDPEMIRAAQSKLSAHKNIIYYNLDLQDVSATGAADLVICVHALYAMPDSARRLHDLRRILRPGGYLYLIDLGRHMDVADWRSYLFTELKRKHGLIGALKIFWQGRQVAKQNKAIYEAQMKGSYWTHTEEEIASAVTAAEFDIIRQEAVYRDQSDLLVCRAKV
ncbi:class I SAM-dependent methyltransferase [Sulfitobacter sp. R18_1]|uniref:class I SAM-dependent methyltransferase n=1 Tax=Sulfitobacter sp. R18_1 TaxID=2821104 RepID=UPI001ADD40F1|nr:class I SAM-dependent methyltransferase [Sulfitobacter sp. R18_1]MBO9428102.1 class I SAM-dependent methyltransferase [Sulfitobacter sp. R18_1]